MQNTETALRIVKRKILAAITMRWFVMLTTAWLFLWGTLVLTLRIASGIESDTMILGAVGIPISLAVAYLLARRETPAPDHIRAKLDARNLNGGIYMASAEMDIPEWTEKIVISSLPNVRWHDNRAVVAFVASCIFVLAAFVIPQPQSPILQNDSLAINELIDEIQAQVELIEEEGIIDEERADTLEENLERIADEATEKDPMRTWEALDHVVDSLEDLSEEAAEELMKLVEDTTTMEAISDSLQEALSENGMSSELGEAMKELAAMMESKELLDKLEGILSPELAEALKNSQLTPEQLKQLSECLSQCKQGTLDKIGKLCNASLIDAEMLEQCKGIAGDCDEALQAFLDENSSDASCTALIALMCSMPGNGGISRGRGDAPLTWTDGSDENNVGFKEQVLQPSAAGGLESSMLVGVSRGAPQENAGNIEATGGALSGAKAGSGGAHKQRVLPQHKQAVTKYFHREER